MNRLLKIVALALLSVWLALPMAAQTPTLGPVQQIIPFVVAPIFNASVANQFVITLTGNVTSSTLINGTIGEQVTFVITQDGSGARTFVWPTNVGGGENVLLAANAVTRESFVFDGTAWAPVNPVSIQQIAAYSNATTGNTSIPELGFSVAPSRNYQAYCRISWSTSNTAAAPSWTATGPSAPTAVIINLLTPTTVSAVGVPAASTAFGTSVANPATVTTATVFTDLVAFQVLNGVNAGVVQVQMKSTSAAGTVTLSPGSGCVVYAQ